MEKNRKAMREAVKAEYFELFYQFLAEHGEDVGKTGSAEMNFPVVDANGNEDFIVLKLVIPTGARDGEEYDGYGAREDWDIKTRVKAEKAAKAEAVKQAKIAKAKAKAVKKTE